jgi:D-sedoheptulose 7-phosphate isomerase
MVCVGFTGGDGGKLAKMVDYPLIIPSRSTPRIQEVHITIGHALCFVVEMVLCGEL